MIIILLWKTRRRDPSCPAPPRRRSRALRTTPIVVLLGARQTGKTTLVRSLPQLTDRPYLTLDDFDLRTQAEADPESVVGRAHALVLDEVQRSPDLLIAVKRGVDDDPARTPGRFVLTGSANLLMLERVSETLAGRAVYVTLWPFTRRERLGLGRSGVWSELLSAPFDRWRDVLAADAGPEEDWRAAVRLGGLPVPAHDLPDDEALSLLFSGYVQTYLERDLRILRAVENLADFRWLMRAACLRIGSLLNQTELGRDVGIVQAVQEMRRFLGQIALLMGTADSLMREKGWEPRAANTCIAGGSVAVYAPEKWMPYCVFRFYRSAQFSNILAAVSVVLDDESEESRLVEPLVTAIALDYGRDKTVPPDWKYEFAALHPYAPDRRDDGSICVTRDPARVWPDDKCAAETVTSFALPLASILDAATLRDKVIVPLDSIARGSRS